MSKVGMVCCLVVLSVSFLTGCSDGVKDAMYMPREGLTEEENEHRRFAWNPKNVFKGEAYERYHPSDKPMPDPEQEARNLQALGQQMQGFGNALAAQNAAENTFIGGASHQSFDRNGNLVYSTRRSTVGNRTTSKEYRAYPNQGYGVETTTIKYR